MSEENQSGIFTPKPLDQNMIPESGAQKAKRIIIAVAAIAAIVAVVLLVRSLWFQPVRSYYRGMSKRNIAQMEGAFPKWLREADMGQENVTVADMCSVVISNMTVRFGADSKARASLVAYTETDPERLTQIAEGIRSKFQINAEVTKGRDCTVKVQYTASDGEKYEVAEYVTMYRINGHWCILDVPNEQK